MMAENSSISFTKEHLKDCDLLPKTFHGIAETSGIVLTLYVQNYRKLKKHVIYYASAKICEYTWTTKLVIANGTLFLFMSTSVNMKCALYAIYKPYGCYAMNDDITQCGCLLISEFCHTAIIDPQNKYLHGDSLLIEFLCELELSENSNYSADFSSLRNFITSGIYCEDFNHLYVPSLKEDLKIRLIDETVSCHKSTLAAHSVLFADFFQKNELAQFIALNEHHRFFQYVKTYMYTGELENLDEAYMMQVHRIANLLKIESLKNKCLDYFKRMNLSS